MQSISIENGYTRTGDEKCNMNDTPSELIDFFVPALMILRSKILPRILPFDYDCLTKGRPKTKSLMQSFQRQDRSVPSRVCLIPYMNYLMQLNRRVPPVLLCIDIVRLSCPP